LEPSFSNIYMDALVAAFWPCDPGNWRGQKGSRSGGLSGRISRNSRPVDMV